MGGDNGVVSIIRGIERSLNKNQELFFLVHGKKSELEKQMEDYPNIQKACKIVPCETVVQMNEKPSNALRSGRDSSMWSCLNSLSKGEANIALSCGNTGALMAMSMVKLRKAPGVNRPAIAILWPAQNNRGFNILLDAGADIRADSGDLLQYTLMGVEYARTGFDISKPRVGLLNVGTEDHKGRSELHEASILIQNEEKKIGHFEFVGFVEGNDMASTEIDIIVTDGFTGNVALKTGEGTASLIKEFLKETFGQSLLARIGALFSLSALKKLNEKIDPRNVNGGIFLGLNGVVIKSHGGADEIGVAAAINLAFQLESSGFSAKLASKFNT